MPKIQAGHVLECGKGLRGDPTVIGPRGEHLVIPEKDVHRAARCAGFRLQRQHELKYGAVFFPAADQVTHLDDDERPADPGIPLIDRSGKAECAPGVGEIGVEIANRDKSFGGPGGGLIGALH